MGKKEAPPDAELDELGLVVHKYVSSVLVVVPQRDFAETTLRYARSALYNIHVRTHLVSTDTEAFLKGELQDEFLVDGLLSDAAMKEFSGAVFCGGPGALEMARDADVQRLAREALEEDKLIASWGLGTAVLAASGVVKGKRKVTGDPSLEGMVRDAGGRYTGVQVQTDGKIVTALDDAAGFRFGKALVEIVRI